MKQKAPRNKSLNDLLMTKAKGGGKHKHPSDKRVDNRLHKELKDELLKVK